MDKEYSDSVKDLDEELTLVDESMKEDTARIKEICIELKRLDTKTRYYYDNYCK